MTDKELRILIMKKYPVTDKERQGCWEEKQRMAEIRQQFKQRFLECEVIIYLPE